ncbi:MAG: desulfoferrodoxin [Spirochaetia bacterium]|jgi:superoxide reductase|nr:desulfoferrodoxin [Spirochaetia bacterium]
MKEQEFYLCKHCGNLIAMVHSAGPRVVCCGDEMTRLIPNSTDAAGEKHVPVVTVNGNTIEVNVGSVDHPMTEAHLIQWIYIQTEQGGQRKILKAGDKPHATFSLAAGDKAVAAYAYCNLHGLWKAEIK